MPAVPRVTSEEATVIRKWVDAKDDFDEKCRRKGETDRAASASSDAYTEATKQLMSLVNSSTAEQRSRSFFAWENHVVTITRGDHVPNVSLLERFP
jgi:hypothetical protein